MEKITREKEKKKKREKLFVKYNWDVSTERVAHTLQ